MRLIRGLRDCKQRSLTVSKKAPTVSKKASPIFLKPWEGHFSSIWHYKNSDYLVQTPLHFHKEQAHKPKCSQMQHFVAFGRQDPFDVRNVKVGQQSRFRPKMICFWIKSRRRKRWKTNGEKMVDFWCRFFHGLVPIFFTVYADFSRFIRDINGEKKTCRYRWAFSRLVFHGLPPLSIKAPICQGFVNRGFQTVVRDFWRGGG